jgi:hypothetical protein
MLSTAFAYPSLGPLLGTTFDKAVGIMVSRWKVLLIVAISSIAVGTFNTALGPLIFNFFLIYWGYTALANAIRLFDPSYKMTAEKVVTLIGINISVGFVDILGFLFLLVPGIWVSNKLSLSEIIAVAEDKSAFEAMPRSWALTTGAFGPTLVFNFVLGLGYLGVVLAGYLMLGFLAQFGFPDVESGTVRSATPLQNAIAMVADAIYNLSIAYATQAVIVAQLYWYRALLQREAFLYPNTQDQTAQVLRS